MSARFSCINCQKNNVTSMPFCKYCGALQSIPVKIPKSATKEMIDEYMKSYYAKLNKTIKKVEDRLDDDIVPYEEDSSSNEQSSTQG